MRLQAERAGLLVVRIWIESDSNAGLRARIIQTIDVASGQEVVTTVASADEVLAAVRAWLEDFLARTPS